MRRVYNVFVDIYSIRPRINERQYGSIEPPPLVALIYIYTHPGEYFANELRYIDCILTFILFYPSTRKYFKRLFLSLLWHLNVDELLCTRIPGAARVYKVYAVEYDSLVQSVYNDADPSISRAFTLATDATVSI